MKPTEQQLCLMAPVLVWSGVDVFFHFDADRTSFAPMGSRAVKVEKNSPMLLLEMHESVKNKAVECQNAPWSVTVLMPNGKLGYRLYEHGEIRNYWELRPIW